jgi:hypothetical protein
MQERQGLRSRAARRLDLVRKERRTLSAETTASGRSSSASYCRMARRVSSRMLDTRLCYRMREAGDECERRATFRWGRHYVKAEG